jgi:hypothetical protein
MIAAFLRVADGGENLLDDRLNVAINLEYAHAEPLHFAIVTR